MLTKSRNIDTLVVRTSNELFIRGCAAPFVEHLQNEKKINYKFTKEKDQIIFSHMVSFCNTGVKVQAF